MWVLPHEPSNRREKANQDSVSSREGSCSWQVGWEEFCWRRPSQEHGVPQCLRWGENPELENNSHLPEWRNGHIAREERTSLRLLLPGDKITAPLPWDALGNQLWAQHSEHSQGFLSQELAQFPLDPFRSSRDNCLQEAQFVSNLVSATFT